MVNRFFRNLAKNFCIYLLTALNLIHAIQSNSFDWLLWVSLILAALSFFLDIISAVKDGRENA